MDIRSEDHYRVEAELRRELENLKLGRTFEGKGIHLTDLAKDLASIVHRPWGGPVRNAGGRSYERDIAFLVARSIKRFTRKLEKPESPIWVRELVPALRRFHELKLELFHVDAYEECYEGTSDFKEWEAFIDGVRASWLRVGHDDPFEEAVALAESQDYWIDPKFTLTKQSSLTLKVIFELTKIVGEDFYVCGKKIGLVIGGPTEEAQVRSGLRALRALVCDGILETNDQYTRSRECKHYRLLKRDAIRRAESNVN